METTVVNRHHLSKDIRLEIDTIYSTYKYIGRGTVFGNKYIIGQDGTRETCILLYKVDFQKRLAEDPAFVRMVQGLMGFHLVCSCNPLPCHGDVIKEYLYSVKHAGSRACTRCGAEIQLAGIDIYACSWCGKNRHV